MEAPERVPQVPVLHLGGGRAFNLEWPISCDFVSAKGGSVLRRLYPPLTILYSLYPAPLTNSHIRAK